MPYTSRVPIILNSEHPLVLQKLKECTEIYVRKIIKYNEQKNECFILHIGNKTLRYNENKKNYLQFVAIANEIKNFNDT